ncbi:methyltransferase [Clostridium botulinum]|uniref:Methyltransferase n=2 Tax=Clostridium botulinum TaxID=1491 RepID=A0A6B4JK62_CLOBO|nr:rRNA adenine N-6-methyltransferase family protein [Clostridium botulinum]EES49342.1 ribosomal RNA adenine dimethylase [Clostridium botulinum E1 str. 'BoNT E Beluga']MBY6760148.1 methyltransferase [Clostridium botulinum]MBY6919057.1 methyltransferase [Clostridium botulinum]MCR1132220.1 methyltransferase [Clostridium botulinum]NFH70563.1 methyltransferase [Clostridium botulinum]
MNARFLMQYFTHPRTTGAIMPSSKKLSYKMIENINFNKCNCIVEFGPGTGVFTEEILKRRNSNTIIMLIEYNEEFYKILKSKYGNIENVYIINDSAENIDYYINKYDITNVDYIVSGLPFASLPQEMSDKILEKSKIVLGDDGNFITFQYTKLKMSLINNYFKNIKAKKEFLNIPPAYVLSCTNKL